MIGRTWLALATGLLLAAPAAFPRHGGVFPPAVKPTNYPPKFIPPVAPGGGGGGGGAGRPTPARPMTPNPGRPGAPNSPGGGPSTPTTGRPSPIPPPGHPNSPFTRGSADGTTGGEWQVWWEFNREIYLVLRDAIPAARAETLGEDFELGQGQVQAGQGAMRPKDVVVEERALPRLFEAIGVGSSIERKCAELLALANAVEPRDRVHTKMALEVLDQLLKSPVQDVRECAALALGVLGDEDALNPLRELAWGGARGAELVGRHEVSLRTRAYALYGLALLALKSDDPDVHSEVVWYLTAAIDRVGDPAPDARVAATIGLGLVPLWIAPESEEVGADKDAHTSRQAQVHRLLRLLRSEREHLLVRAHAATSAARLLYLTPQDLHERVKKELVAALGSDSRLPVEVRQSVVIALGLVADADADELDGTARDALMRIARRGSAMERRFALIALGHVGARAGENEPFAGTPVVRQFLLGQLGTARADLQPWAALSLGVLGNALRESGIAPSEDVDLALRLRCARCRVPERLGAYAIALGLRRDGRAAEVLSEKLDELSDEDALGYVALGLGLCGARVAMEPIERHLTEARTRGLRQRAAIALALLGDGRIVERLTTLLEEAEEDVPKETLAAALGPVGDERALEALGALLVDGEASSAARAWAGRSLGRICDEGRLSYRAQLSIDLNYAANTETLANAAGTGVLNLR